MSESVSSQGDDPVPELDELVVAAFHKAGHAVAGTMRGGSSVTSVTLDDHICRGTFWARCEDWDRAFVIWAGPWVEAR